MYMRQMLLPLMVIITTTTSAAELVPQTSSDFDIWNAALKIEIRTGGKVVSAGSGTWLDDSHVLTASHLWLGVGKDYEVDIVNKHGSLPAKVVKIDNPEKRDLALLEVKKNKNVQPPQNWKLPICDKEPTAAEKVWVLSGMYNSLSSTYMSPDSVYYYKGKSGSNGLTGFFKPGVSGSSVLNESKKCVYGVVSQENIGKFDSFFIYTTNITTSETIQKFLNESGLKS